MTGLQVFILLMTLIATLSWAHVRYMRAKLIKELIHEGKNADDIDVILTAYRGDK